MSSDRNSRIGMRHGPMGGGPGRFAAMGAKARDFRGTMRQLVSYLKPYRLTIAIVWILAIV